MAALLPVGGSPPVYVRPADGRTAFTLAELQAFVGGYIEIVRIDWMFAGQPGYLVINETGKLDGLARNGFATALYRAGRRTHDTIVGPALVATAEELGEGDDEGE